MLRLTCCVIALLALGCTASRQQLTSTAAERAAFDLNCPAAEISTTQLGDTVVIGRTTDSPGLERTVFGVSGCGKKAVYVVECVSQLGGSSCNAMLNADEQPAP